MAKIIPVIILILTMLSANAQPVLDSVTIMTQRKALAKELAKEITDNFPTIRFLDVQYEQLGHSDYHSEIPDVGRNYESGDLKSQKRLRVVMNVPIWTHKKSLLSTSLRYKYEDWHFGDMQLPPGTNPLLLHSSNEHFHYFWASLNYSHYDRLFGKSFVSNITVSADASDKNFGMINASYIGLFILQKNELTTIAAGLLLQSSPGALFPVMPVFNYMHQFTSTRWFVDFSFPKQLYFRRMMFKSDRLSLGTELTPNSFYINSSYTGQPKDYIYNRNELKYGFLYEHYLSNHLIAGLRAGLNSSLQDSFREKYKSDEVLTSHHDPGLYFSVGLSYNILNGRK